MKDELIAKMTLELTRIIIDECFEVSVPIEKDTFEDAAAEVISGNASICSLIDDFESDSLTEPGQFGITEIGLMWSALVLPAVYTFISQVAQKISGKIADKSADKIIAYMNIQLQSDNAADDLCQELSSEGLAELKKCFKERAEKLGLPASSYKEFIKAAMNKNIII